MEERGDRGKGRRRGELREGGRVGMCVRGLKGIDQMGEGGG